MSGLIEAECPGCTHTGDEEQRFVREIWRASLFLHLCDHQSPPLPRSSSPTSLFPCLLPAQGFLPTLNAGMRDLCIYCILSLLKDRQSQQLEREALIAKLYRVPLSDVDFALPQIWYGPPLRIRSPPLRLLRILSSS